MTKRPRIAVLVDLPRDMSAGGHVKYWEQIAQACVKDDAQVDLTVYFSGNKDDDILSPHVRFRYRPPVFSTARLKFLPYVPAHTDLAPFHPQLAKELIDYDVLHSTDAYFAFARTAERISLKREIPLVTSFHTDTPAYAELFTNQTLQSLLGRKGGNRLDRLFNISSRERLKKQSRLKKHLKRCSAILTMRPEDRAFAEEVTDATKIFPMRLGVNKDLLRPREDARSTVEQSCDIPEGRFVALFVGRVDAGKNVPLLLQACKDALQQGTNLHLIVVGLGPMVHDVKKVLGNNATTTGLLAPKDLAMLYAGSDCLCMASDIEIGGLVGVEALSCGCPVFVSKSSGVASLYGVSEAIKDVTSDASSWTNALVSIVHNRAQLARMKQAALVYRQKKIAGWSDVLREDFLPVWQKVVR